MPHPNAVTENVLGTIGTICWTGQLLPQVWKSWRHHSTNGLSPYLVFLWGIGSVFLGLYAILQDLNIPLIIQPQLFGFLCLVCWGQCQYYEGGWSRKKAIVGTLVVMILCGAIETMLVLAIRPSHNRGHHTPATVFGIFSSVVIAVGLFPQYWEIYKHKEVIGISLVFMTIDLLGGVFNDLSLAFKPKFDVIAALTYSLVIFLDAIVILAAIILNPMARRRRRRRAEADEATEGVVANRNFATHNDPENGRDTSITETALTIRSSNIRMPRLPSITSTVVEETEESRRWTDEKKAQILQDGMMSGASKLQDQKVRHISDLTVDGGIDNSRELAASGSADCDV